MYSSFENDKKMYESQVHRNNEKLRVGKEEKKKMKRCSKTPGTEEE
jgi:hypothetical protein